MLMWSLKIIKLCMNCSIIAVVMGIIFSIMGEHCSNKASRTTQAAQAFYLDTFL